MDRSNRIKKSVEDLFKMYNNLRRRGLEGTHTAAEQKKIKHPFWDIIVLTTFDEAQKLCFERQIENKRECGELPEVPIYVIADPPGHKMGIGGSTLYVLTKLHTELADSIYEKKIIILHSGGSSQRLPSYSATGKIFLPIPAETLMLGSKVPQMLDIKLALHLPYCRLLKPGVLVSCSDDIATYCLEVDDLDIQALQDSDVVALAHPSSPATAGGHGVYVVDDAKDKEAPSCVRECVEVLQKPSQAEIRAAGAVWVEDHEGSSRERIWGDSVFWLGWDVCRDLLHWFDAHHPTASELDAYAHFLPCLGSRKSQAKPSDFSDYRADMLPIFQGRKFKVILLSDSETYHLGTMEEYLAHFNVVKSFGHELGILNNTSNIKIPCLVKSAQENSQPVLPSSGTFIQTHFSTPNLRVTIPEKSTQFVIEKCNIDLPLSVMGSTILSGCSILKCPSVSFLSSTVTIFSNLLYHTVPIINQGKSIYVTIAFDLNAQMKAESDTLSGVRIYGRKLSEVDQILDLKLTPKSGQSLSLWDAQVFSGADSPEESFWLTHHDVNKVRCETEGAVLETDVSGCRKTGLFSMREIVKCKDLKKLFC